MKEEEKEADMAMKDADVPTLDDQAKPEEQEPRVVTITVSPDGKSCVIKDSGGEYGKWEKDFQTVPQRIKSLLDVNDQEGKLKQKTS